MVKGFLVAFQLLFFLMACSSEDTPGQPKPTPDPDPVAKADKLSAVENEEYTFQSSILLENDEIVDNARIKDFDNETTAGGSITDNRDGTYTYTPPADFKGDDTFDYTLCVPGDSNRCSTATVTISVGDAGDPVAIDDSYQINENESYTIRNYLNNDDLKDNATVTDVLSESGNATVTLQEDGSIRYVPNEHFSGEDTFTYTICDDDETPNCSTATITMTVVDEGSPKAEDDSVIIASGTTETTFKNLLDNDDLIDDAVITSVESTGNGTATLNEDGTVTFEPQAGFSGDDTFTYTICDDDVDQFCSTATVTVSVVESYGFNIPADLEYYYGDAIFAKGGGTIAYQLLSDFTNAMHTTHLEYTDRHDYLYDADADPADPSKVILMYSGESRPDDQYQLHEPPLRGETFNTEHIYPQSKLDHDEAANDLHHMRVADIDVNSERSYYPFTDGTGTYKLVDGNKWFPGDDWRGDVARMVMYVNLAYGDSFDEVGSKDLFLKWNREDPVSEFEIQRNNVIEGAQGNRNPFIDNPYLATLIWGGEPAQNRWQ
ncbi:endonuclease I [Christiangramia fulva]|uniref:Endonuclease I n=2 Tax=Christiangramia fulva TaxID=2126553 RepID=A0A2R3ZAZ7_9FLAO|nr:endonuclease I [Christiangramia fulva]